MNRSSKSLFNLLGCCDAGEQLRREEGTERVLDLEEVSRIRESFVNSISLSNIVEGGVGREREMETPNLSSIPSYQNQNGKQQYTSSISYQRNQQSIPSRVVKSPNLIKFRNLTIPSKQAMTPQQYESIISEEKAKNQRLEIQNSELQRVLKMNEHKISVYQREMRWVVRQYNPSKARQSHKENVVEEVKEIMKHYKDENARMTNEMKMFKEKLDTASSVRDEESILQHSSINNITFGETINHLLSEVRILNQEICELKSNEVIYQKQCEDSSREKREIMNESKDLSVIKEKYSKSIGEIERLIQNLKREKELGLGGFTSDTPQRTQKGIHQLNIDVANWIRHDTHPSSLSVKDILQLLQ